MMKPENRIHAMVAERALNHVYVGTDEQNIADMLSDIRHLCDRLGLEFHKLDRRAYRNYSGEGGAQ